MNLPDTAPLAATVLPVIVHIILPVQFTKQIPCLVLILLLPGMMIAPTITVVQALDLWSGGRVFQIVLPEMLL